MNFFRLRACLISLVACVTAVFASTAWAASADQGGAVQSFTEDGFYIIQLQEPALVNFRGTAQLKGLAQQGKAAQLLPEMAATSPSVTGAARLDTRTEASQTYLSFLAERRQNFIQQAETLLGADLDVRHRYSNAFNGMAVALSASQANQLARLPAVKTIAKDVILKRETFAGPQWINADHVWTGSAGFPSNRGEGVVVGVLDGGVNWESPSFEDIATDGYNHNNPRGQQFGLCDQFNVPCNDKLIGIYEFVEDDPDTDVVEEPNMGRDNDVGIGHGSHVASTAAGNPVSILLTVPDGGPEIQLDLSGVAPRANLITYRVCFTGDPDDPEDDGCQGSAIIAALDQAIDDQVDVVNFSIGSGARDPWTFIRLNDNRVDFAEAFLNLMEAGIFAATSAGNSGSAAGTVGSPANAPWLAAVGNASHNGKIGNQLTNFSGGNNPPGDLVGNGLTAGLGPLRIVHAADFGNALCGTGEAELQNSCAAHTGSSNPFPPNTFNGEIVVCDRGNYGRIEKSFNVRAAGAAGFVLANTNAQGESLGSEFDDFCLPSVHVGDDAGDELRAWLDTPGDNHRAEIDGAQLVRDSSFGDLLNPSSSRGPNVDPAKNVLKPNLIAPGTNIWAATEDGSNYRTLSGTSMASPHVTGAGALIRNEHPDWSPMEVLSALQLTAEPGDAIDFDGSAATPIKIGSGRPQVDDAINTGLVMSETGDNFRDADPLRGGDPRTLNLPSMVNFDCGQSCTFTRTVTDVVGGASWSVSSSMQAGTISVSPTNFTLPTGGSQTLTITIDLSDQQGLLGLESAGEVVLTSAGLPPARLTAFVATDLALTIETDSDRGHEGFSLTSPQALPDATYNVGGLVAPTEVTRTIPEDPTNNSPYDNDNGTFTEIVSVSSTSLRLQVATDSLFAPDVDLFVGRDSNGNGDAEESEELCVSNDPNADELCVLDDPQAGDYWIVVQNWNGSGSGSDAVNLRYASLETDAPGTFAATGPGIVDAGETIPMTFVWDNTTLEVDETWWGVVSVGTDRASPGNSMRVPVTLTRVEDGEESGFGLMNGKTHRMTLQPGQDRERLFIDVPPNAASLDVLVEPVGGESLDDISLQLHRVDFDDAFDNEPFISDLPAGTPMVMRGARSGNNLRAQVNASSLDAGRWYVVLTNSNSTDTIGAAVTAELSTEAGGMIEPDWGLWRGTRPLQHGFEYNRVGDNRFFAWYSYDDDGVPTWFFSGTRISAENGNAWTADLIRLTNDGNLQQFTVIGELALTQLAEDDIIFTYTLNGGTGSERMSVTGLNTCPDSGNYTGLWELGGPQQGGYSFLLNDGNPVFNAPPTEVQTHYFYDANGRPTWFIANENYQPGDETEETTLDLLSFRGYCQLCEPETITSEVVGTSTRTLDSETSGTLTVDYVLTAPLEGDVTRNYDVGRLTDPVLCEADR